MSLNQTNKPKKILVIGAGLAQADAICKAKRLGYYVMASDGAADAVGLKYANESKIIDVRDVGANLEWAREKKVDGVISYASDVTLPTVAAIREVMGLPGLDRVPMEISLDKSRQREVLGKAGLPQPEFRVAINWNGCCHAAGEIELPLVVKPADNSGSRGVFVVRHKDELHQAFQAAFFHSKLGKVVVEEFIDGVELTVEGLSINRKHRILAISDKIKPAGDYCVATQLAYPADISAEMEQQVSSIMQKAYDQLGIDNSPTHSEVIIGSHGPKIIEIGCRGGGFYVFTRAVEAASGYPIVENWTRMCTGDAADEVETQRRGVVLRFLAAQPGTLVDCKGIEEANDIDGVDCGLFVNKGDIIPRLVNDGSRTGWMLAVASDRAKALAKADRVSSLIRFNVESH